MTHVDDFVSDYRRDTPAEKYARWWLFLHRLPADLRLAFCSEIDKFELYCDNDDMTMRVITVSRTGHVVLSPNLISARYECVSVDDCSNWRREFVSEFKVEAVRIGAIERFEKREGLL